MVTALGQMANADWRSFSDMNDFVIPTDVLNQKHHSLNRSGLAASYTKSEVATRHLVRYRFLRSDTVA